MSNAQAAQLIMDLGVLWFIYFIWFNGLAGFVAYRRGRSAVGIILLGCSLIPILPNTSAILALAIAFLLPPVTVSDIKIEGDKPDD